MRIKSVRARLTLWYSSLLTVTFLLLAGAAHWLLVYTLSHDVDAALQGVAQALIEQARERSGPFFPPDIDDVFRRFFGYSPLDRYFEMRDPSGRRDPQRSRLHSGKLALSPQALKNASQGLPTFETVKGIEKYPVRVLTAPVVERGRVVNLVQVGMSLKNMTQTRSRFLIITLALLSVALLFSGGGGWILIRRALKPVENMTESAERISAEALTERLKETGAEDELDRLAKTLNRMLGRLDIAFSQIRRFSADASHELQTPLTILKGELEVALRSQRSPEEYQQILFSALEEIDRIAQLVEGLLLLARADAGVLKMDARPVSLPQLLEDIRDRTEILAKTHNITLRMEPLEPITILGDPERLQRLLLNVVENGIKYTPPGGQITLSLKKEEKWANIIISDNGVGIPHEEQAKIFQPFYRSLKARAQEETGVGLGLSIALSIAEAHAGRIDVESTPGRGAVFTIRLPLHP